MKKLLFVVMFLVAFAGVVLAGQRYNPFSRKWETVPDYYITQDPFTKEYRKEEPRLKYNPFENQWKYTDPNAQPEYNPFERKWEFPK